MTVTNEERRAVAKRLRGVEPVELDDGEFVDCGEVETELGLRSDDGAWYEADAVRRLADLIEPTERTCAVEHRGGGVFHLSCGHDSTEHVKPDYCPTCGARVVDE